MEISQERTGPQGSPASRALAEVARRRRRTIRLPEDLAWVDEITPASRRLLSRMAKRGLLYRVGEDRYVIAPAGTSSLNQAAAPELLVDLVLGRHPYYIGFLSALIAHRLTDLHSEAMYAAVPRGVRLRGEMPLALKVAQLGPKAWPAADEEIERFRALEGTKEFARRSGVERTLVDCLLRPDLCGGFETATLAWARAQRRADVLWDRVAQIARRTGDSASRRTAFMLDLVGLEQVVELHFGDLEGRRASIPLDRSNAFGLTRPDLARDRRTGILLNVPHDHLRGWVTGEAFS